LSRSVPSKRVYGSLDTDQLAPVLTGEKKCKIKRETKAVNTAAAQHAGVKKTTAKEQKRAIKRKRRDLLKKGMKYEVLPRQH